jgi:hypothetical protein
MSSIPEEIQQLQLRILELEKQQKEKIESDNKTSMEHNLNIINNLLNDKKESIIYYEYKKDFPLSKKGYNYELVTHLEAIYNILQIIDERVKNLEQK